jgi:hypothetical protein
MKKNKIINAEIEVENYSLLAVAGLILTILMYFK